MGTDSKAPRQPVTHTSKAVLRGHSDQRAASDQLDPCGRKLDLGEAPGGRPRASAIHVQAMQDELSDYLQAEKLAGRQSKQDPTCIDFVAERLKARGWRMGRTTILRKVVAPVHQRIWAE
jgi:hypothetical protein